MSEPREASAVLTDIPDAATHEANESNKQQSVWHRRARRVGWTLCLPGLILTLLGTFQLSQAAPGERAVARWLHSSGLFVLLSGFALALLIKRLPGLKIFLAALPSKVARPAVDADNSDGETGRQSPKHGHWLRLTILVSAASSVWGFSVVLVSHLPFLWSGVFTSMGTMALLGSAVVMVAYGTRRQRTFSLGAAIPLVVVGYYLVQSTVFITLRVNTNNRWWESDKIFDQLFDICCYLGGAFRFHVMLAWATALLIGLATLTVDRLLERFNS